MSSPYRISPGDDLGRFTVIGLIGKGGMGEVYLATEPIEGNDSRRVALKILPPDSTGPEAGRRFEKERELLTRIDHKHVVASLGPLEFDKARGLSYFPMELVLGKNLSDLLGEHGPFPVLESVRILAEIASALEAAHAERIVHRDVKPSNILMDREGHIRLSDFGLARALDGSRLTRTGATLGTPAYMSPEQADGNEAVPHSDLYGLGAVAYELLTGRPPFKAEHVVALLRMHLEVQPEPPKTLRPEIPEALNDLILRLLSKEPEARGTSTEILGILETMGEASGSEASAFIDQITSGIEEATVSFITPVDEWKPSTRGRKTRSGRVGLKAIAIGGILLCLMVGLVVWMMPTAPPEGRPKARIVLVTGEVLEGTIAGYEGNAVILWNQEEGYQTIERQEVRALEFDAPYQEQEPEPSGDSQQDDTW